MLLTMRFLITVRIRGTTFLHKLRSVRSEMDFRPKQPHVRTPIRASTRMLLRITDHRTPLIRSHPAEAILGFVPLVDHLHERREILHTRLA